MIPVLSRFLAGALLAALSGLATADCPRIVSQSPYISAALDWLARGHCIVGVSRYDTRDLPRTGGVMDPDAEALAVLDPQLVLTSNWAAAEAMQKVVPAGARLLQVDGFASLADAEAMLRRIGEASAVADLDARLAVWRRDWQAAAAAVGGQGRRALVLSACSAMPYSFGRGHYVGDAFAAAGFVVVESAPRLRHIRPGEEIEDLLSAVDVLDPEVVFSLDRKDAEQCNALLGLLPVPVIHLDGANFFHPGTGLVAGFAELADKLR
ncbi:hypothetical protein C8261_07660 [Pseudothauera lacus]|uniref:Periplasmic binding protein n=1 Tax=Pseudothauera lacus TaxID=2136175 RepID=A0A2T4IFX0_9RHOO|nr:hypothetical protein C8261_07660 [Pseudothauera lacus]